MKSRRSNRRLAATAGLAAVLALAACSEGVVASSSTSPSAAAAAAAASTATPTTAADWATYNGPNRQSLLEACAKQEGQVSIIAGEFTDTVITPLQKKFNQLYPYIKVNSIRMDEPGMVTRVSQEARAGKGTIDVLDNGPESFDTLQKADLLQSYYSPYAKDYTKDEIGPDNYYVAVRESVMAPVYNTKLLPASLVPKTWDDLLNPALKGKMVIANSDVLGQWITTMIAIMGQTAAAQYFQKMSQQNIKVYNTSVRALVDLVGGGEAPMAITAEAIHAEAAKAKGSPVAWAQINPLVGWTNSMARVKNAPHPCAAALWTDFMLNPAQGQAILATVGYLPAAPSTKSQYTAITSSPTHYNDQLWESANATLLENWENQYFLNK